MHGFKEIRTCFDRCLPARRIFIIKTRRVISARRSSLPGDFCCFLSLRFVVPSRVVIRTVCGDLWRLVNSVCMSAWPYFDTFQRTAGGCCRFSTCRMWTNAPGITAGLLAAYCACRVDTYHMTVSPRPKSSVRPHADRKLRPMANFVLTTVLFYNVLISNCRVADSISSSA